MARPGAKRLGGCGRACGAEVPEGENPLRVPIDNDDEE
jgi:hypothetical protein